MNIADLSTALHQDQYGVWVSSSAAEISYPSDGNSRCFQVEDRSYWFEHRNNVISDAVRKHSCDTQNSKLDFIDIGGGNGFVSERLEADGHNVVLLEPGPEGALNARTQRGLSHVICATLQDAKIKPRSFDAAGAFDVIEHIEDDDDFVSNIASIIKPKGIFVATLPAHQWLWSQKDIDAGHFRRYNESSFLSLVAPFFEPMQISYFFGPLVIPILILKAIPYRFGLTRQRTTEEESVEHGTAGGPITYAIRQLLSCELDKLMSGNRIQVGSSLLFVGTKRRDAAT